MATVSQQTVSHLHCQASNNVVKQESVTSNRGLLVSAPCTFIDGYQHVGGSKDVGNL